MLDSGLFFFPFAFVSSTQGEQVPGLGDVHLKFFEGLHGFLDDVEKLLLSGLRVVDQLDELPVEMFQLDRLLIHAVNVPGGVSQCANL